MKNMLTYAGSVELVLRDIEALWNVDPEATLVLELV